MRGFSRKYRLASQKEFQHIWEMPKKIYSNYGLIFFRANKKPWSRLGIIVKKSTVKLASSRNRTRRIVRESFRSQVNKINGLDIIVLMRIKCTPSNKIEIRQGFDKLWQQLTNYPK